jgi:hypothetical protein
MRIRQTLSTYPKGAPLQWWVGSLVAGGSTPMGMYAESSGGEDSRGPLNRISILSE